MAISEGDRLPGAHLVTMGDDGPVQVELAGHLQGRKVVIFGLPGAFTGTCSTAHLPSFIRTRDAFSEKGVDEVICLAVNDPFVMRAWAEITGADKANITMLSDAESSFTKAIGMDFTAPQVGMVDRSKRYAMMVDDGIVKVLMTETNPGVCDVSGGEALLEAI